MQRNSKRNRKSSNNDKKKDKLRSSNLNHLKQSEKYYEKT